MSAAKDAMVKNAADPEQVATAGNRQVTEELARQLRWAAVLASADGRAVLDEILDYAGVDRTPIGTSSEMTHFLVGKQDVGFFITAQQRAARERLTPSPE